MALNNPCGRGRTARHHGELRESRTERHGLRDRGSSVGASRLSADGSVGASRECRRSRRMAFSDELRRSPARRPQPMAAVRRAARAERAAPHAVARREVYPLFHCSHPVAEHVDGATGACRRRHRLTIVPSADLGDDDAPNWRTPSPLTAPNAPGSAPRATRGTSGFRRAGRASLRVCQCAAQRPTRPGRCVALFGTRSVSIRGPWSTVGVHSVPDRVPDLRIRAVGGSTREGLTGVPPRMRGGEPRGT